MKKVLIISNGPVPTPEHPTVEGGGLRCWGLARGLKKSHAALDITVAYDEAFKAQDAFTSELDGLHIEVYNLRSLPGLLSSFDSVIVSYCMSAISVRTIEALRPDQQLILDCNVPIFIEVSARQSSDQEEELRTYKEDLKKWSQVLKRGDLFLCASIEQKRFYQGVIAALGKINPLTYCEDPILVVPYGIYREVPSQTAHPIEDMIGPLHRDYKKILWFGGIYPWFDLTKLVDSVSKLNEAIPAKLIIVGAKNPFNINPDFIRKYEELVAYVRDNNLNEVVLIQDWVRFEDRANWYLDCDLVVVINNDGLENELAWRTRLVDFVWANLAIVTNGGDPVSEMLITAGAAAQFDVTEASPMAEEMKRLLGSPEALGAIRGNLLNVREDLYWDVVTMELGERIEEGFRPKDSRVVGLFEHVKAPGISRTTRIRNKLRRVPAYIKDHGILATGGKAASVVARRIGARAARLTENESTEGPRVVIISHQLDLSGAPFVIIGFAKEMRALYPDLPIVFFTYLPTYPANIVSLNDSGIKPRIIEDRDATIPFQQGDVVVLNTVAHRPLLIDDLFNRLENGFLRRLIWFVHEDEPDQIFDRTSTERIKGLLKAGRLDFYMAAEKAMFSYRAYFGFPQHIHLQKYKVVSDQKYHRVLEAADFSKKLTFVLPGTFTDGRKGQLPIFYAFEEFLDRYYRVDPDKYRDFELVFVGMDKDFLSRQVEMHHEKSLGSRIKTYGRLSHEDCMNVVMQSNVTICYSLRESLPLFVFEGMIAGHPILRNDSSGMEEQLEDGRNGFFLDSHDFRQVVEVLERVLNKEKTTDETLASMSKESYRIAKLQEENSYRAMIDNARLALNA